MPTYKHIITGATVEVAKGTILPNVYEEAEPAKKKAKKEPVPKQTTETKESAPAKDDAKTNAKKVKK